VKAVTLAVPCRADEPELGRTLEAAYASWRAAGRALPFEVLVCLNGGDAQGSRAFAALAGFAARHGTAVAHVDIDGGGGVPGAGRSGSAPASASAGADCQAGALAAGASDPVRATDARARTFEAPPAVVALTTAREGKAIAWNWLRRHARGDVAVFLDADVDLSPDAVGLLLRALEAAPGAAIVSPKTTCAPRPGEFERIMAVPYRIDFPNLSGQLYAARLAALPETMPEDLIEPERWLELALGRERFAREPAARVVVRLPGTLRDFFRQRIRIEMGKVQIAAEYAHLETRGVPQPRLRAALAALGAADLVRLGVYLTLRQTAHAIARRRWRQGRTAGVWRSVASTKRWTAAGV